LEKTEAGLKTTNFSRIRSACTLTYENAYRQEVRNYSHVDLIIMLSESIVNKDPHWLETAKQQAPNISKMFTTAYKIESKLGNFFSSMYHPRAIKMTIRNKNIYELHNSLCYDDVALRTSAIEMTV
jgi:hypothetical protein